MKKRFSSYDSQDSFPYLISGINFYKILERHGCAKIDSKTDKFKLDFSDLSAVSKVLDELGQIFEAILDAEDEGNAEKLEKIQTELQEMGKTVPYIVKKLIGKEI